MSGIMHKIGETLHMGGHKDGEKHKEEEQKHYGEGHKEGEHKGHGGEHKEGMIEKIKDKIHGEGEQKKKKKEKKKREDGYEHHGDSSSSDSD